MNHRIESENKIFRESEKKLEHDANIQSNSSQHVRWNEIKKENSNN